jgi:carboxyl-terminal processing protease
MTAVEGSRLALASALLAMLVACGGEWKGGIHARMAWSEVGGLRVLEVPEGGPAWTAGLRAGDRIVSVDGVAVSGRPQAEVVEALRGDVGTTVELEVQRDGEPQTIRIERAPYEAEEK